MNLSRTPSGGDRAQVRVEEEIRTQYRRWRHLLHKAKDHRVKVLHALAREDNQEAAMLLGEPGRVVGAVRCRICAGCRLLEEEKVCGSCKGCQVRGGCEDHHRRCRDWERRMCTDHAGSSITAISSQFDVMTADLGSYRAVVDELRELDVEMADNFDQLSENSDLRKNPRYAESTREQELDDESHHLGKLTAMLQVHSEQQARLAEVTEEETEPGENNWGPDIVPPIKDVENMRGRKEVIPTSHTLSGTATHRELVGMFQNHDPTALGVLGEEEVEVQDQDKTTVVADDEVEGGTSRAGSASLESLLRGRSESGSPSRAGNEEILPPVDPFPHWQPTTQLTAPPPVSQYSQVTPEYMLQVCLQESGSMLWQLGLDLECPSPSMWDHKDRGLVWM